MERGKGTTIEQARPQPEGGARAVEQRGVPRLPALPRT